MMADDLDVNEVDDGLIVYQPSTDRVHHLNSTASVVLLLCDGNRSIDEIAQGLSDLFPLDAPARSETEECVAGLARERLVH